MNMRICANNQLCRRLVDLGLLCGIGLAVAYVVGILQDPTPFGDDSIHHVGGIRALTSSFPYLAWNPHAFAGYIPTIGLSWLTYLPPSLLVAMGIDVIVAFHIAFVCVFLLFGTSVFYFARSVGSDRIVSFSISILAWSTNAYWNNTVWGGAYTRAFTIPFMFIALGATYRYIRDLNHGEANKSDYLLCLGLWTLTCLGDVFVAIAGVGLGLIFLLLSAGIDGIVRGLKRVVLVFLPVVGLVLWQIVPLAFQAAVEGPYRNQYTIPNDWTVLFVPGSAWTSTLNLVYVPLTLSFALICLCTRARVSLTERAFLSSLFVIGSYWFVMGWVPSSWPYLPRLMATNSSVDNLAWIFLMALPLLFAVVRRRLVSCG